jgi:hypothetical protein
MSIDKGILVLTGASLDKIDYLVDLFDKHDWAYAEDFTKLFRFDMSKYLEESVDEFAKEFMTRAEEWTKALKKALNKQAPEDVIRQGKASSLGRHFPYKREGHLRQSVMADIGYYQSRSGKSYMVSGWFAVFEASARLTTRGVPARKDDKIGTWVGWVEDVFYGSGRLKVPSVADIFDIMRKERGFVPKK